MKLCEILSNDQVNVGEIEATLDDIQQEIGLIRSTAVRKRAIAMMDLIDRALHVEHDLVRAQLVTGELVDFVRQHIELD